MLFFAIFATVRCSLGPAGREQIIPAEKSIDSLFFKFVDTQREPKRIHMFGLASRLRIR